MTKLNPAYKAHVCNAMINGSSYLPLEHFITNLDHTKEVVALKKKLQKAIHRYSKKNYSNDGRSTVTTYENNFNELVILRKENVLTPTKNYQPGVIAEVIGQEVPSLQNRAFEYIPSPQKPKSLVHEFKVGDSGTLFCGEPYVVLEKKNNGELLVNVKSKGRWKIGLRKSDGTCVYDYPNKHQWALLPPVQSTIQKRTIYVNVYKDNVFCYSTKEYAEKRSRWRKVFCPESSEAIAVAVPVTFEFTPIH